MRASAWFGITLSLMVFVVVGCGASLTADNKKLGDDYIAKVGQVTSADTKEKRDPFAKEAKDLYKKITELKPDQSTALEDHFKTKIKDAKKAFDEKTAKD